MNILDRAIVDRVASVGICISALPSINYVDACLANNSNRNLKQRPTGCTGQYNGRVTVCANDGSQYRSHQINRGHSRDGQWQFCCSPVVDGGLAGFCPVHRCEQATRPKLAYRIIHTEGRHWCMEAAAKFESKLLWH